MMKETMLYEDYLRQQVDRGEFGVCIIPADIATGIAEYLEMHRNDATVVRCKDCKHGRFNEKDGLFCDWFYGYNPVDYGQEGYCSHGERRDDDACR